MDLPSNKVPKPLQSLLELQRSDRDDHNDHNEQGTALEYLQALPDSRWVPSTDFLNGAPHPLNSPTPTPSEYISTQSSPNADSESKPRPEWCMKPYSRVKPPTLGEVITGDYGQRDLKTGGLYIFTRESDREYIKIGATITPISQRVKRWNLQCGYTPELLYSVEDVPHVYRLEKLVHTELHKSRHTENYCKFGKAHRRSLSSRYDNDINCESKHNEWFKTDIETIKTVVDKWRYWLDQSPYEYTPTIVFWYAMKLKIGVVLPRLSFPGSGQSSIITLPEPKPRLKRKSSDVHNTVAAKRAAAGAPSEESRLGFQVTKNATKPDDRVEEK